MAITPIPLISGKKETGSDLISLVRETHPAILPILHDENHARQIFEARVARQQVGAEFAGRRITVVYRRRRT